MWRICKSPLQLHIMAPSVIGFEAPPHMTAPSFIGFDGPTERTFSLKFAYLPHDHHMSATHKNGKYASCNVKRGEYVNPPSSSISWPHQSLALRPHPT